MGFLDGKIAVVTGGSRGIGRAIVQALVKEGARVALCARDRAAAEKAAAEIGAGAVGLACDVQDFTQVRAFFAEAAKRLGGVDVLINNAGVGLFGPVADMKPEDWRSVIGTNLDGVFYCCHEVIPLMRKRGGGYIVNIASLAGKQATPNLAAYNASKFGLIGFSEALFQEIRYDGIRVSYVMPGSVATEFGRGSLAKSGWALTGDDVAEVVVDLLRMSPRALASRVELRPSQPPKK
jgi:NAD(P)-dependent dehydrogenase (short-subunit alcohol dehydrogenase family)